MDRILEIGGREVVSRWSLDVSGRGAWWDGWSVVSWAMFLLNLTGST
jgi:hypothetical protein